MPSSTSIRLAIMMFLNFVIWGAWYSTISTYLTTKLSFTGTEAGSVFGTAALACIISPFFVGMVADRFFSTERVLLRPASYWRGDSLPCCSCAQFHGDLYADADLLSLLLSDDGADNVDHAQKLPGCA